MANLTITVVLAVLLLLVAVMAWRYRRLWREGEQYAQNLRTECTDAQRRARDAEVYVTEMQATYDKALFRAQDAEDLVYELRDRYPDLFEPDGGHAEPEVVVPEVVPTMARDRFPHGIPQQVIDVAESYTGTWHQVAPPAPAYADLDAPSEALQTWKSVAAEQGVPELHSPSWAELGTSAYLAIQPSPEALRAADHEMALERGGTVLALPEAHSTRKPRRGNGRKGGRI